MIKKLTHSDSKVISQPVAEKESDQSTATAASSFKPGVSGTTDVFEVQQPESAEASSDPRPMHWTDIITNPFGDGFSGPSETPEDPFTTPAYAISSLSTSVSSTEGGLSPDRQRTEIEAKVPDTTDPPRQTPDPRPLHWTDFITNPFGDGFSIPSTPIDQRGSTPGYLRRFLSQTAEGMNNVPQTDRQQTEVAGGLLSQDSITGSPAGAVSSVSVPTSLKKQMVDDLINQINQLLISFPDDQRAYWENALEEKIKQHFYDATGVSLGNFGLSSNVRYFPRDPAYINWDYALEDLQALFAQVQAAQQPSQVNVNPSPEG